MDFETTWPSLRDSVSRILTVSSTRGTSIIEQVYAVCTASPRPLAEELYHRLREFLESHARSVYQSLSTCPESEVLRVYEREWSRFSVGAEYLHSAFRYLNRHWIRKVTEGVGSDAGKTNGVQEIEALCMTLWREHVLLRSLHLVTPRVVWAMRSDRRGDAAGGEMMGRAERVLESAARLSSRAPKSGEAVGPELYVRHFEQMLLQETEQFYARDMADCVASQGVTAFLERAELRVEEEEARIRVVVLTPLGSAPCAERMRQAVYRAVVNRQRQAVLSECEGFLSAGKTAELSRATRLLRLVDGGLTDLSAIAESWMIREWACLIAASGDEDPRRYVESLIDVHGRGAELVRTAFGDDRLFLLSLDRTCKLLFNRDGNKERTPELLARYCDLLFRQSAGTSGGAPEDVECRVVDDAKIAQILCVFRYTEEKDIFQRFYARLLAKRLIMGTSTSHDAECSMIAGLRQVCGFEYANRLARMFTDMAVSAELNNEFLEIAIEMRQRRPFDFTVQVLTTGFWPLQTQLSMANFRPHREVAACMQQYSEFYIAKHQGRKLQWLHHLGKAELRSGAFSGVSAKRSRTYDFQVSGLQASVLLLLNDVYSVTRTTVHESTGLNLADVDGVLASLEEAKVIREVPSDETSQDGGEEHFEINPGFYSKRLKVKVGATSGAGGRIASSAKAAADSERAATYKSVEEDRKIYLQATIVRVMKARRELTHVQLAQEVIAQAYGRFVPSSSSIRSSIESLVEKDFLCRVGEQGDRYSYVA